MQVTVITHPNARVPRIETDLLGQIHVYVNAPPLEGKANNAVIEALAVHYKVAPSLITLVHGSKSKHKTFTVPENTT